MPDIGVHIHYRDNCVTTLPHQPSGGPGEQQPADGEDGQSEANSEAGRPIVTVTRGGKRKQANASVLKEYMARLRSLVEPGEVPYIFPEMTCNRSVARLRSLVEEYMGQKLCGEHHGLLYTYGSSARHVSMQQPAHHVIDCGE